MIDKNDWMSQSETRCDRKAILWNWLGFTFKFYQREFLNDHDKHRPLKNLDWNEERVMGKF